MPERANVKSGRRRVPRGTGRRQPRWWALLAVAGFVLLAALGVALAIDDLGPVLDQLMADQDREQEAEESRYGLALPDHY